MPYDRLISTVLSCAFTLSSSVRAAEEDELCRRGLKQVVTPQVEVVRETYELDTGKTIVVVVTETDSVGVTTKAQEPPKVPPEILAWLKKELRTSNLPPEAFDSEISTPHGLAILTTAPRGGLKASTASHPQLVEIKGFADRRTLQIQTPSPVIHMDWESSGRFLGVFLEDGHVIMIAPVPNATDERIRSLNVPQGFRVGAFDWDSEGKINIHELVDDKNGKKIPSTLTPRTLSKTMSVSDSAE